MFHTVQHFGWCDAQPVLQQMDQGGVDLDDLRITVLTRQGCNDIHGVENKMRVDLADQQGVFQPVFFPFVFQQIFRILLQRVQHRVIHTAEIPDLIVRIDLRTGFRMAFLDAAHGAGQILQRRQFAPDHGEQDKHGEQQGGDKADQDGQEIGLEVLEERKRGSISDKDTPVPIPDGRYKMIPGGRIDMVCVVIDIWNAVSSGKHVCIVRGIQKISEKIVKSNVVKERRGHALYVCKQIGRVGKSSDNAGPSGDRFLARQSQRIASAVGGLIQRADPHVLVVLQNVGISRRRQEYVIVCILLADRGEKSSVHIIQHNTAADLAAAGITGQQQIDAGGIPLCF